MTKKERYPHKIKELYEAIKRKDESKKKVRYFYLVFVITLTLPLLEPKIISLCHLYRGRPACTSMQSDQALYCWLANFKFS